MFGWLKVFTSICVVGGIIWVLLQQTQLQDLWALLKRVSFSWMLVGLGWYGITNVFRAYRLAAFLGWRGLSKPLTLLPEMVYLSFFNNIMPSRSGELSFPLMMYRRHQVDVGKSAGLLLVIRIFDLMTVLLLFLAFALFNLKQTNPENIKIFSTVSLAILPLLFLLILLPWVGHLTVQFLSNILERVGLHHRSISKKGVSVMHNIVETVQVVRSPILFMRLLFWSCLGWLTTYLWFAAFLNGVGYSLPYSTVVLGASVATIGKAIPLATIAGFGAHDAGWVLGFTLMGETAVDATLQAFAVNILTIFASSIFAGVSLLYSFTHKLWMGFY